jgi:hypothetical protein
MGFQAGQTNQGTNSIAIGSYAGQTNQARNSIVINASGVALNGATASACYINPLRSISGTYYTVWDTSSKEFGYFTSSKKRKCNIKDFDDTSSILKLQPKSYNFKGDDSFRNMIGHIAEDVYEIDPRLTIQEDDKPNALEYFTMMTFAINELRKLREEFDAYKLAHP